MDKDADLIVKVSDVHASRSLNQKPRAYLKKNEVYFRNNNETNKKDLIYEFF